MRRIVFLLIFVAVVAAPLAAQTPGRRFTAGDALEVASYLVQDISDDGNWVATTVSTRRDQLGIDHRRDGDPSYIRPSLSRLVVLPSTGGAPRDVFPNKRNIRSAAWAPDGRRLAVLVLQGDAFVPIVWDRESGKTIPLKLPVDRYLAENSELRWNRAGTKLVFALRSRQWKEKLATRFAEMTAGPVFVQSSSEPFLAWDALRRQGAMRAIVAYDLKTGRIDELVPEALVPTWHLAEDDSTVVFQEDITPKTDYDVIFGTETKLIAKQGGSTRTLMPSTKGLSLTWTRDGLKYAYLKDGRLMVATAMDTVARQIAGPAGEAKTPVDTSKAARTARDKERFTPARWSGDGSELIATNSEGFWFLDGATGAKTMFLATPDSTTMPPRYSVVAWSEDRQVVYLSQSSRTGWERGFSRYDRRTGRLETTTSDGRVYSTPRFARNGGRAVVSISSGSRPADLYAADGDLRQLTRLVETNPQLANVDFGKSELIDYLDVDGKRQFGVVYLPPGYQVGQRYPTVCYVYESFFDDRYESIISTLTGSGYVVVQPSVSLETGYPGESWLKGVTAAANHLIQRGIADSARLGLQGISYGGYATNLLVTQTPRFKAAINISGKVDIISFYTDSPRLGVRNVHAAEKSQDRIGATLWQQPQKYVQHSAVMFADRITTPLLLMTGALDSNVPADNTREMYYALRRLGKEVTWVNYLNGGHGTPATTADDFLDFHRRIVAWYDKYLKAATAATTSN